MFDACEWECNWVMSHPEGYDGPMHQKAVCGNIRKRYAAEKAKRLVAEYAENGITENKFALLEFFGHKY